LFQSGQITEAKRLLTPVNQFTEAWNRGKALLMLGEIALQEQYPQEALDYLTKETALFTAPAEQTTLFYLQGKSYQMLGEDAKGLKAFQRCTEISGEAKDSALSAIREQCFFQVGDILMRQHQYPEALSLYQKILQAFPQSTRREWTLLQIAQIYRHLSDEQGVITTLTTLRASTNSPFWQLVATEHLHDFQWQKQFDPRLAEFQNSLLQ
jgi:tetratricopeptide (TPR) repeat protein